MKNKLYVHDEAPPELKENVNLAQQCLGNMMQYKEKSEIGTLTIADLKTMARRNSEIIDCFPGGDATKVGLPAEINNMDELKALARSRSEETARLMGHSKPVYQVQSVRELNNLCSKPPEEIADLFMAAAEKQKREAKATQPASADGEPPDTVPSRPKKAAPTFPTFQLAGNHLEETVALLASCKEMFFYLYMDWHEIESLERQFEIHVDGISETGEPAIAFLGSYLTGEADDEEIEEKKPAAAFLLASLPDESGFDVERLIALLRDDEEKRAFVVPALKYGLNKEICEKLNESFSGEPPHIQSARIEAAYYRDCFDCENYIPYMETYDPAVQAEIVLAMSLSGISPLPAVSNGLLESDESDTFEKALFANLMAGDPDSLQKARKHAGLHPEQTVRLPLYLACSGDCRDYPAIVQCLLFEASKPYAIKALGIMGLKKAIPLLIERLSQEEWEMQKLIADSLELITGAGLARPDPDVSEGPEGYEYEVVVETGWGIIWSDWWEKNSRRFDPDMRYRRGKPCTLTAAIDEMEYPMGNYWSRQYAYYELRIRSGCHIAHFEADWYVADQKAAIGKWRDWQETASERFGNAQWLFAGKDLQEYLKQRPITDKQ